MSLATSVATVHQYAVGNSLTADAWHSQGIASFAAQRGISYDWGLTINTSRGLKDSWDQYLDGVAPYYDIPSSFDVALASGQTDSLMLQPFKYTAAQESEAAKDIIKYAMNNPLNANMAVWIWAPPTEETADLKTDFNGQWVAPYNGEAVGNETSRAFFKTVYQSVKTDFPTQRVGMIPAGEVWAAVAAKIDAGQFPGLTNSSLLYRDQLHATELGQLISVATWFTVTLHQDPRGLTMVSGFGSTTQAQADVIYQTVLDVVKAQSAVDFYLKPGDANGDDRVNFDDLLALAQNYGTTKNPTWAQADFDGDGSVDFGDVLIMAQNYKETGAATPPAASAQFAADWALAQSLVPEPVSASLLAASAPLLIRRRSRSN